MLPVAKYAPWEHYSVIDGYVHRGQYFPALQGIYLYGDLYTGVIWACAPDGAGGWNNARVLQSNTRLSSFGEDAAGELYITDLSGAVYRLVIDGA